MQIIIVFWFRSHVDLLQKLWDAPCHVTRMRGIGLTAMRSSLRRQSGDGVSHALAEYAPARDHDVVAESSGLRGGKGSQGQLCHPTA